MSEKKVLDPCCGSKMMWFDKQHPEVLYADSRIESHVLCDGRTLSISPDMLIDFTAMPFQDGQFSLVVFDPPHLIRLGKNSWMAKKYGVLPKAWREVIKAGFEECWRVLKNDGTLIFKWNENQIPIKQVIEAVGRKPLFGHPSGRHGQTIWMTFFKSE